MENSRTDKQIPVDNSKKNHEMSITVEKSEDFSKWYRQIVTKSNMIKYYDVSGCYVLLPNSYGIWENIKTYLDTNFKNLGVQNSYFPLFIPKSNMEKEQNHIDGFQPEVAWVTKVGNLEDEENYLEEPLAIRPTSECAIYSIYPSLIQSYNDLPLKLNQWCNVVRWEFKDPYPFIRSREFLWQEGHTCFSNKNDAIDEINNIIDIYKNCYENILATPTIKGFKTEKEKFAGAELTFTLEGFIPEIGKGLQACTAHYLGQNFSKMFGISFQDENRKNQFVHQNSWGFTTRSIGAMLMTHGDNKGPIIPPNIATIQIVVIPIIFKNKEKIVNDYIDKIFETCCQQFFIKIDSSDHKPGWKYNYWEVQGVPLRIEIGPKDVTDNSIMICRRDTGEKISLKNDSNLINNIQKILDDIQENLLINARHKMFSKIKCPKSKDLFINYLNKKNICLINWCNRIDCENNIKEITMAKSLCKPIDDSLNEYIDIKNCLDIKTCIFCANENKSLCLFGRSF